MECFGKSKWLQVNRRLDYPSGLYDLRAGSANESGNDRGQETEDQAGGAGRIKRVNEETKTEKKTEGVLGKEGEPEGISGFASSSIQDQAGEAYGYYDPEARGEPT